jgi:hypothetical protein
MKTIQINDHLRQIMERDMQEDYENFKRKGIELYKQTDRYKEYEKRKRAEMESEKPKEE